MNILLTGAKGFIGSNIALHIKGKHTVFTPGHKELDLLDEQAVLDFFKNHSIDLVIHCALVGGSRKEEYVHSMFYDNIRMFFNIVRCQKYFHRMINIGSGAEYDKRFPIVSVKEGDIEKRIPADEYGLFKYICARYIDEMKCIVDLRVFGMFGEGEDYRYRFISNVLCRHIYHLPITMGQDVYFDYMDIKDFVRIVEFFIEHEPQSASYNIGTGKKINLLTIAKKINDLTGEKREIIVKKSGVNNEYTCNSSRLLSELKGFTFTPLESSLKRLYLWYLRKKDTIDKHSL